MERYQWTCVPGMEWLFQGENLSEKVRESLEKLACTPVKGEAGAAKEQKVLGIKKANLLEERKIRQALIVQEDRHSLIIPKVGMIEFSKNELTLVDEEHPQVPQLFCLFLARILQPLGFLCFWGEILEQSCWIMADFKCHYHCIFLNWKEAKYLNKFGKYEDLEKNFSFLRLDPFLRSSSPYGEKAQRKMGTEELYSFLYYHCLRPNPHACKLLSQNFTGLILGDMPEEKNLNVFQKRPIGGYGQ